MIFKTVWQALATVYSSWRYFVLTFIIAVAFFLIDLFVNNSSLFFFDSPFFFSLWLGVVRAQMAFSLLVLILLSLLTGIVIAMLFFLIRRQIRGPFTSLSGVFFGLLAPSCPSCAMGLLSVLGFGGFLAVLPFQGAELSVFAVILLLISIFFLSRKITTSRCPL